jgi:hypothetical protein
MRAVHPEIPLDSASSAESTTSSGGGGGGGGDDDEADAEELVAIARMPAGESRTTLASAAAAPRRNAMRGNTRTRSTSMTGVDHSESMSPAPGVRARVSRGCWCKCERV